MTDSQRQIVRELSLAIEKLGADFELLSIVNSWGDTMDDEDTLAFLVDYNETGTIFKEIICSV